MSLKKLSVLVFTLALLFSIQPTFAYHSSSYPETNLTIDQIKNHSYSLRVYENADTVFSFLT